MKNDQQNPNDNTQFGLQKRTPSHKPKEDDVNDVDDAIGEFEDEMKDVKKSVKKNTENYFLIMLFILIGINKNVFLFLK